MPELEIEGETGKVFAHTSVTGDKNFVLHVSDDDGMAMVILSPEKAKTLAEFLTPEQRQENRNG